MIGLPGVRYTLLERRASRTSSDPALTLGAVEVLPEWLGRLRTVEIARVTEDVRDASEFRRCLGAVLSRHAAALARTAILKVLEASRERLGEEGC
jgi:hypothetical protein